MLHDSLLLGLEMIMMACFKSFFSVEGTRFSHMCERNCLRNQLITKRLIKKCKDSKTKLNMKVFETVKADGINDVKVTQKNCL